MNATWWDERRLEYADLASGNLRFLNPWFFLLLAAIPLLWWWLGRRRTAAAVGYSTLAPLAQIGRHRGSRGGWAAHLLLSVSLCLLVLAMARPQAGRSFTRVRASGVDILLVLDVSSSMLAEDFTIGGQRASRIATARSVTEEFIAQRPNDRIGILGFGGQPYLACPLTLDHRALTDALGQIDINLNNDGTAIGSAIASAANRLKDRDSRSRVVILLTDGTNNAGRIKPSTAAEAAAAIEIRIYTIGVGTEGFAPAPQVRPDRFGRPLFVTDRRGQVLYRRVPVQFDEDALREIAKTTGGQYFRATDTASFEDIYRQIDTMEKTEEDRTDYHSYRDLFVWPLMPGALLLIAWILLQHSLWRRLP